METEKYLALRAAVYQVAKNIAKVINEDTAKHGYKSICEDVYVQDLYSLVAGEMMGFATCFEISTRYTYAVRELQKLAHTFYSEDSCLNVTHNAICLTIHVTFKQAEKLKENGGNYDDYQLLDID